MMMIMKKKILAKICVVQESEKQNLPLTKLKQVNVDAEKASGLMKMNAKCVK